MGFDPQHWTQPGAGRPTGAGRPVAREAEKTKLAANDIRVPIEGNDLDVTSFLAKQAVESSSKLMV